MLDSFFSIPEWIRYVIAWHTIFWGLLIACLGYLYTISIIETRRERKKKGKQRSMNEKPTGPFE